MAREGGEEVRSSKVFRGMGKDEKVRDVLHFLLLLGWLDLGVPNGMGSRI